MTTYNVYRRNTVSDTPVAITTGLSSKNYSDATAIKGNTYLYSIGAVKNGIEKVSSEISKLAGIPWNPENLTNTAKLWLSSESVVVNASNQISQMTDLSPNGFNATQATNANKPVLINSAAKFDGVDDFMNVSGASALFNNASYGYIFAVFNKSALDTVSTERPILVFSNTSTAYRLGLNFSNLNKIYFGGRRLDGDAYSGISTNFSVEANEYYIAVGVVDYTQRSLKLYVNGVLEASNDAAFTTAGATSNTNSLNVRVGSNLAVTPTALLNGSLKSALVNNTLLSDADRQKLEGWAAHKYGLQAKLPSNHPYKTNPPVQ